MKTTFISRSFVAASILLLTFACDEGDDARLDNCKIMESHTVYTDGEPEDCAYTYNGEGLLVSYLLRYGDPILPDYSLLTSFEYDADGKKIKEQYDEGLGVYYYALYTYNNDGQLIKEEYYQENSLTAYNKVEYNSSGQVIKRQHYDVEGDVATADYYGTYEYANTTTKNLWRYSNYHQAGTLKYTIEYEYDNKINPWALNGMSRSENNTIKRTRTEGDEVGVIQYVYKYNANDYPIEMTYIDEDGVERFTEAYLYVCE
jgi:hypothetical protein